MECLWCSITSVFVSTANLSESSVMFTHSESRAVTWAVVLAMPLALLAAGCSAQRGDGGLGKHEQAERAYAEAVALLDAKRAELARLEIDLDRLKADIAAYSRIVNQIEDLALNAHMRAAELGQEIVETDEQKLKRENEEATRHETCKRFDERDKALKAHIVKQRERISKAEDAAEAAELNRS
jgi:Asp-tRNA(Asn)/Glu-tRNA(Gln) amidotransferase A subunit family amidase